MKAEAKAELREGIFDPEEENMKRALNLLESTRVKNIELSKMYGNDNIEDMCTTLLTNPVIHKYTIRKG